ncbi:MAG: polysaccharide biosynthesis protein [Bacteroidales bacterium]|nr:polysaccharide biosynthesis protein [Bacteroidales bacterium]
MMLTLQKYFRKFIYNRYLPRWVVLSGDLFIVIASFLLAYLLRYNFSAAFINAESQGIQLGIVTMAYLGAFLLVKPFAGVMRHTTLHDLARISFSLFVGFMVLVVYNFIIIVFALPMLWLIPLSVMIIQLAAALVLMSFARVAVKHVYDMLIKPDSRAIPVMIYGAGELGHTALQAIERTRQPYYLPVGFVDINHSLQGKIKSGLFIYSPDAALRNVIKSRGVKEIIMAISKERVLQIETERFLDGCVKQGLTVKKVPPVEEWINGNFSLRQARNIEITDLLGRQEIKLNTQQIQAGMEGKKILVTGAAGSIGSEIVRQLMSFKTGKIILLDKAESPLYNLQMELHRKYNGSREHQVVIADITDRNRLERVFAEHRPDIIFTAAAYKHVPLMEEHVYEAVNVNIGGTRNLAEFAVKYGCSKFVMISTDKAVNPTSVMGATKRISEIYLQKIASDCGGSTSFITTRFGNVLGSDGSVVPLFKKQIETGGPVTITHKDIERFFMTIPEACQLVLEAGFMGKGGEIFVFDMGKPVRIYDLAHKMITLAGYVPGEDIKIVETGLRPGEKLYEEVLGSLENTHKTHNPKLMIANHRHVNCEVTGKAVDALLRAINSESAEELVARMCDLVKEFKPSNEKYRYINCKDKRQELLVKYIESRKTRINGVNGTRVLK